MPVTIMLCCNDWRNGNPTPYAESVELFECQLSGGRVRVDWDKKPLPESKPYQGEQTLRVGKLRLPCLAYNTWVGNWCWDAASIRLIYAVEIWNYLAERPDWHCEAGPVKLFQLFNECGKIDPRTAPEFLKAALS